MCAGWNSGLLFPQACPSGKSDTISLAAQAGCPAVALSISLPVPSPPWVLGRLEAIGGQGVTSAHIPGTSLDMRNVFPPWAAILGRNQLAFPVYGLPPAWSMSVQLEMFPYLSPYMLWESELPCPNSFWPGLHPVSHLSGFQVWV